MTLVGELGAQVLLMKSSKLHPSCTIQGVLFRQVRAAQGVLFGHVRTAQSVLFRQVWAAQGVLLRQVRAAQSKQAAVTQMVHHHA